MTWVNRTSISCSMQADKLVTGFSSCCREDLFGRLSLSHGLFPTQLVQSLASPSSGPEYIVPALPSGMIADGLFKHQASRATTPNRTNT